MSAVYNTDGRKLILNTDTLEWVKTYLPLVTVKGRKLSREQRMRFLSTGILPDGAAYPAAMRPGSWNEDPEVLAAIQSGKSAGPFAVWRKGEPGFFQRQIRSRT